MRRIDLHEISARYPGAIEWFDTSCSRFVELETRFYERGVPEEHRRDRHRGCVRVELVAVASVAKPHADGSGNLFTSGQVEARWVAALNLWVVHTSEISSRPFKSLGSYADLTASPGSYFNVGDVVWIDGEGLAYRHMRSRGGLPLYSIGTAAEVVVETPRKGKKRIMVRVVLTSDGERALTERGIAYDVRVEVRNSEYGRLGDYVDQMQERVSSACGMPAELLFDSDPGDEA